MKMKSIMRLISLGVLTAFIFMIINKANDTTPLTEKNEKSYYDIAMAIKAKYDQNLHALTDYQASHYAARIYRTSGDTSYLDHNLRDLKLMIAKVEELLHIAENKSEVEYSRIKADGWTSGVRSDLRRQSLTVAADFPYYLSSLGILRRTLEYRICSPLFERLKERVLAHEYSDYLSNPVMIRAWAAQLANTVAWIKQLGGRDYSDVFINAMQQVYPDDQDHLLNTQQYENKIYGLTHLILANSQYYQYSINRSDFLWIFNYFDSQIDIIVARVKADVIAEVGITYLLAREFDNSALEKTKSNIAKQYNEPHQMIPGQNDDFDIPAGAHRNILSIILLYSPEKLYPGPWLNPIPEVTRC